MSKRNGNRGGGETREVTLLTSVDDELYDELSELTGQRVVHVALWEESLADALAGELADAETDPERQSTFDLDLYLDEGVYFELYGASAFTDLDAPPVTGADPMARLLLTAVDRGVWLEEIAVDEEDNLVLILGRQEVPALYLTVGGWLLEEWEELPA